MPILAKVRSVFQNLFQGVRVERDLDEEIRSYLAERMARNLDAGMAPEAARRAALVELGGVEQVKADVRHARLGYGIETTLQDVSYGFRALARTPLFAVVVVLTLALGIGANVTMFSVMYSVLWRSLPYPAADRLVLLDADVGAVTGAGLAPGEALGIRAESQVLDQVATVVGVDAHLTVDGEMDHVAAASATNGALPMLGGEPMALGRNLRSEKEDVGQFVRAVVISNSLWRRRFHADPHAVGRHAQVNNLDVEIVGVLPPDFRVFLPAGSNTPEDVDIWFPRSFGQDRHYRTHATIARLKPGARLQGLQAELDVLASRFMREYPAAYSRGALHLRARPLREAVVGDVRPRLLMLGVAVGFVLLIACVNVANLMLARARSREREFAVRRALGATRSRLIRQLLTESLLLALLGGAAGLVVSGGAVALLDWLRPADLPRQSGISIDAMVGIYTVALSVTVGLVFGLLPALRLAAGHTYEALRSGRMDTLLPGARRLQRTLVVAEIALSIVPLVAAGLMLRSFVNLAQAPIGFDPTDVVTAKVPYNFRAFEAGDRRIRLHQEAIAHVRQLPGVMAVSAAGPLPFSGLEWTKRYGRDGDAEGPRWRATAQSVMPGYLRVVGVTLREGRDFNDEDITSQGAVAIVDERLARQLWPSGAVGRRMTVEMARDEIKTLEVIGVTNPVRVTRVRDDAMPHIFLPYPLWQVEMALVLKTHESPAVVGPAIKQTVESLGTERPVYDIRPMREYVEQSIGDTQLTMMVLIGFATASLLLAAVGLYGTLAYFISQRTHELGIRMALGASAERVVRMILSEGVLLTAMGVTIGLAASAATGSAIRGLLYNVTPLDAMTLFGVAGVSALAAIAATAHPAWRASRIDPCVALRQ
jgi:putative ABC transport system permease protein